MQDLARIWNRRQMVKMFVVTELKRRYRNSALGFTWTILEPLLMLSVLVLVFSNLHRNDTLPNFILYVLLNLILWQYFARGTASGLNSILAKGRMINQVYFPRQILPLSSSLAYTVMITFEFVIFFIFMVAFQFAPSSTILILPAIVALEFILILGVSLALSALQVYFRDMTYIWQVIIYALFFMTPIFYSLDALPGNIRSLILLNPVAQLVTMAHNATLYSQLPSLTDVVYTLGTIFAALFVGMMIFKILEKGLAEQI